MIKDKLIYSSEASNLYKSCYSCHKNSHILSDCPMLNILVNRSLLITKYNVSFPQERQFQRRKDHKYNTMNLKSYTEKSQALFIANFDRNDDLKIETLSRILTGSLDSDENASPGIKEIKLTNHEEINQNSNENQNFLDSRKIFDNTHSTVIENSHSGSGIDNQKISSEKYYESENFNQIKEIPINLEIESPKSKNMHTPSLKIKGKNRPKTTKKIIFLENLEKINTKTEKLSNIDKYEHNSTLYEKPSNNEKTTFLETPLIDKKASFTMKHTLKDCLTGCDNEITSMNHMKESKSLVEIEQQHTITNEQKYNIQRSTTIETGNSKTKDINEKNNVTKNDELYQMNDFERMKIFIKYQPQFNYNVIIMLINKEYYYRQKKRRHNNIKKKKNKKLKSEVLSALKLASSVHNISYSPNIGKKTSIFKAHCNKV